MIEPSSIQDASTKKVLVKTNNVAVFTKSGLSLVEPISLTLHQGQNVTILGETGSGKSLLAQAIMGALPEELVAQGDILIENQSLDKVATACILGTPYGDATARAKPLAQSHHDHARSSVGKPVFCGEKRQ